MSEKEGRLSDALLKVALGFQVSETVEEFAEVDGELKLMKRKKTKKDVPPDLKAVQILLGENGESGVERLSDEELEEEKERLLAALKASGNVAVKKTVKTAKTVKEAGQVCVEKEKKPRPKPRKRVIRKNKEK